MYETNPLSHETLRTKSPEQSRTVAKEMGQVALETLVEDQPNPALSRIESETKFKEYNTTEIINNILTGVKSLGEQEVENVHDVINMAVELHIDQSDRPSGEPYVNHVLGVARRLVSEYGVTKPDMIIAALLHDSVEDQSSKLAALSQSVAGSERDKAYDALSSHFSPRVTEIVHALSNEEVPKDLDRTTKNRIYLEHVMEAVKDPEVCLIKLADFSENALSLENVKDPEKRLKLTKKYAPVVDMFINRLQDNDIDMGPEQKDVLLTKLRAARVKMEEYSR